MLAVTPESLLKNRFVAHPANNALGSAVGGPQYLAPRSLLPTPASCACRGPRLLRRGFQQAPKPPVDTKPRKECALILAASPSQARLRRCNHPIGHSYVRKNSHFFNDPFQSAQHRAKRGINRPGMFSHGAVPGESREVHHEMPTYASLFAFSSCP